MPMPPGNRPGPNMPDRLVSMSVSPAIPIPRPSNSKLRSRNPPAAASIQVKSPSNQKCSEKRYPTVPPRASSASPETVAAAALKDARMR